MLSTQLMGSFKQPLRTSQKGCKKNCARIQGQKVMNVLETPPTAKPVNDELFKVLEHNSEWAQNIISRDPEYFKTLSQDQAPEFLWIGCGDSRIVVNDSTGLGAGEVFVHRNVGNIVSHQDMNCMSVLQFAVEALGVKHVVVCGHTCCGAVRAALFGGAPPIVDSWIEPIRVTKNSNLEEINRLTGDKQWDRLVELNVVQQVYQVCTTEVVQNAWRNGKELHVHGMVNDLRTGKLNRVVGPVTDVLHKDFATKTDLDIKLGLMLDLFTKAGPLKEAVKEEAKGNHNFLSKLIGRLRKSKN
eukprot:TRINITY_DN5413_c0_g1_i1.p1 TRINITY_DN5413_c0_g1~~TRINITY_DN5413_c0_g1_i1.p1  ORF type:complete len:300 (-),score=37.76 TRINITY_DN5413_c0_g1_i1:410-1309(-)